MAQSIPQGQPNPAAQVAAAVAAHRRAAGLSLTALAERSGLSAGFLSQIESGTANPTLAALGQLAQGLGVGLADVVAQGPSRPAAAPQFRPRVRRPPAPPAHPGSGRVWELTAPGAWSLRACLVEGEPGDHAAALEHEGEELVAVLTGQFQLCIGEQLYTLDAGDVAHYPAVSSHRLSPLARGARALIVLAPTA